MNPTIWGPPAWDFLHTVTFNYPDNPTSYEMQQAALFFTSLGDLLPCVICQQHYKKNLEKYPIRMAVINRNNLVSWLINIHNEVNIILGKRVYSVQEVISDYNNKIGGSGNNKVKGGGKKYLFIYLIVLLVLIVLVYYIINI